MDDSAQFSYRPHPVDLSDEAPEAALAPRFDTLWPTLTALILGLLFFPVPGQDDFFITLWPATTLAETGQILNYNGQSIEQSSALLLTFLLGGIGALTGLDPAIPARLLSALCAVACLLFLRRAVGLSTAQALWARWILALSAPFLYWAASGTEMPIMALLLLAWVAILRSDQAPGRLAIPFIISTTALIANRPEGIFICSSVLCALLGLSLISRFGATKAAVLAGNTSPSPIRVIMMLLGTAACFALVALWRQITFGSIWPLPVSAKMGGAKIGHGQVLERLESGFSYLLAWNGLGLLGLPLLVVVLVAGLRLALIHGGLPKGHRHSESGLLLCALVAAAYLGFTVTSGGDWMEAGRFLVPAMPFLAVIGAQAIVSCQGISMAGRGLSLILGLALLGSGALSIGAVIEHPKTRALALWDSGQLADGPAAHRPWAERSNKAQIRDLAVLNFLDEIVSAAAERSPSPLVLSSHQMGYVAYTLARRHPDRLRFIDAAGLVEPSLVECQAIHGRVSHNAGGLWRKGFAYDPYLKVRFLLENVFDCADELPRHRPGDGPIDILYELGIPDEDLLSEYGLGLVYVQDGRFLDRPSFTFVALREAWIAELGLESVRVVKYASEGKLVTIEQTQRPASKDTGAAGSPSAQASEAGT